MNQSQQVQYPNPQFYQGGNPQFVRAYNQIPPSQRGTPSSLNQDEAELLKKNYANTVMTDLEVAASHCNHRDKNGVPTLRAISDEMGRPKLYCRVCHTSFYDIDLTNSNEISTFVEPMVDLIENIKHYLNLPESTIRELGSISAFLRKLVPLIESYGTVYDTPLQVLIPDVENRVGISSMDMYNIIRSGGNIPNGVVPPQQQAGMSYMQNNGVGMGCSPYIQNQNVTPQDYYNQQGQGIIYPQQDWNPNGTMASQLGPQVQPVPPNFNTQNMNASNGNVFGNFNTQPPQQTNNSVPEEKNITVTRSFTV